MRSDMDRVDRMVTKALGLLTLTWGLTLTGGGATIWNITSNARETAKKTEDEIKKTSEETRVALTAILESAPELVAKKIKEEVDVSALANELKNERIPEIEARLKQDVSNTAERLRNQLQMLDVLLAERQRQIDDLSKQFNQLVLIDKTIGELDGLDISLYGLGLGPSLARVGDAAQLVVRVSCRGTSKRIVIPAIIEFSVFEQKFTKDVELFSGDESHVDIPIKIPEEILETKVPIGDGEYSLSVKVLSRDAKNILAHESTFVRIYSR